MHRIQIAKKYQITVPRDLAEAVQWSIGASRFAVLAGMQINFCRSPGLGQGSTEVVLRDRYQLTLPKFVVTKLGVSEADVLECRVAGDQLVIEHKAIMEPGINRLIPTTAQPISAAPKNFTPPQGLVELAKRPRLVRRHK